MENTDLEVQIMLIPQQVSLGKEITILFAYKHVINVLWKHRMLLHSEFEIFHM